MARAKLFGLPSDTDRATIKRLLECCDEASEEELAAGPAQDTGWVVHTAAVDAFRAVRGGNDLHAVIWLPASGEPPPPEDWWTDFHAVFREGNDGDTRSLANFSRCPACLELAEDVEDIDEGWFLTLTDNPAHRLVLEQLPAWFRDKYSGVLGSSPEALAELAAALGSRAGRIWHSLLPDSEEIAAWLTGDADPAIEELARKCPILQKLIQEQGHLWLDADLIDQPTLQTKLAAVGLGAPEPRRESPVQEPSRPVTGWAVRVAVKATREVWDTAGNFAAAVVAGLMSQAHLSPAVSLSRGAPTSSEREGGLKPMPSAELTPAEFLLVNQFIRLQTADQSRKVTVTLQGDNVVIRVRPWGGAQPPRVVFLRGYEPVDLPVEGVVDEDQTGKVTLTTDDRRRAIEAEVTGIDLG